MSLPDIFGRFWSNHSKLGYVRLGADRTERALNPQALSAGQHYFRLRLAEMFLKKESRIGQTWYPAVHSLVQMQLGDSQVQIPNIADATRVGTQQINSGDIVIRNFVMTPVLPFNGGSVTIDAGLMAIRGQNYLNTLVSVLSNFATLLAVPQISSVLNIVQPLADGIQALFGAGDGEIQIGLREAFSANDGVTECYLAVINAPADQINANKLWVVGDRLCEGSGTADGQYAPFEKFDHMLLRLEIFEKRDDWDALTAIADPFREAITHLGDEDLQKADFALRRAKLAARLAPELTRAHRRIVIEELQANYDEAKEQMGVSGLVGDELTLGSIMRQSTRSTKQAIEQGDLNLGELLELGE